MPAEVRAEIAADEAAQAQLEQLRQIRGALRDLPDVMPDPEVFERIQGRLASAPPDSDPQVQPLFAAKPKPEPRRWQLRFPLATAASVFLLAALGSAIWLPQMADTGPGPGSGPAPLVADGTAVDAATPAMSSSISALIGRSQQLEAVARLPVSSTGDRPARSRQALLYRIADLDAELNALIEEEPMNPELKEQLWRQRVQLLETLVAVQQEQMADAAGLY